jgi:hypothetical protein
MDSPCLDNLQQCWDRPGVLENGLQSMLRLSNCFRIRLRKRKHQRCHLGNVFLGRHDMDVVLIVIGIVLVSRPSRFNSAARRTLLELCCHQKKKQFSSATNPTYHWFVVHDHTQGTDRTVCEYQAFSYLRARTDLGSTEGPSTKEPENRTY